jgi:hypothetical protein
MLFTKKKEFHVLFIRDDLPKGNDGLGLMLLGVTGEQVLPKEVYEKIKPKLFALFEELFRQIF